AVRHQPGAGAMAHTAGGAAAPRLAGGSATLPRAAGRRRPVGPGRGIAALRLLSTAVREGVQNVTRERLNDIGPLPFAGFMIRRLRSDAAMPVQPIFPGSGAPGPASAPATTRRSRSRPPTRRAGTLPHGPAFSHQSARA